METLYLTRRNLLTLLSKLDRAKAGEKTDCAIVKMDTKHPKFPCSTHVFIMAVEDTDYYADRSPGWVDPRDLRD